MSSNVVEEGSVEGIEREVEGIRITFASELREDVRRGDEKKGSAQGVKPNRDDITELTAKELLLTDEGDRECQGVNLSGGEILKHLLRMYEEGSAWQTKSQFNTTARSNISSAHPLIRASQVRSGHFQLTRPGAVIGRRDEEEGRGMEGRTL